MKCRMYYVFCLWGFVCFFLLFPVIANKNVMYITLGWLMASAA